MNKSLSVEVSPWRLSWDTILFIVLWLARFWSNELAGLVLPSRTDNVSLVVHLTHILYYDPIPALLLLLLVLVLYVGADLLLTGHTQFRVKLVALWLAIIAFVIIPTGLAILYRHKTFPYLYIHDGAIQTEEAIKFLLAGKNPYAESYATTPMGQWPFHEPGVSRNPALDHLPYLPFTFLSAIPLYLTAQITLGWYDQRLVYLLMFVVMLPMLLQLGRTPRDKLAAVMVVALNPLFVPFFIEGRNDIVVLFWLVGAMLLLQQRRIGWAGVFIACAAASKQTAWFLLPFFVLYVLDPATRKNWRELITRARTLLPAILLFALVIVPFLIWNASALLTAVLILPSGNSAADSIYPIRSMGLGGLLLGLGLIKQSTDPFPFSWFQLFFCGLGLVFLLYAQWRNNTGIQMIMNFALLLFIYLFFARSFVDNYLGFLLTWLVLPTFFNDSANQPQGRMI
jgi:hypothetical protein